MDTIKKFIKMTIKLGKKLKRRNPQEWTQEDENTLEELEDQKYKWGESPTPEQQEEVEGTNFSNLD